MDNLLKSIRNAIAEKNWYGALFVTLTLPDICVALQNGKTTGEKYAQWFDTNLPAYKGYLSGNDCYALRCAVLHQGKDNISDQKMRDVLEHYIFSTSNNHKILMKNCTFDGKRESFLQLNVQRFCEEICNAVGKWLELNIADSSIQSRLEDTISIREPGYTYKGIRFG